MSMMAVTYPTIPGTNGGGAGDQGQNYPPASSLYVGDLHPEVMESTLFEKFSQSGPVLSIRVCRDLITLRSLGYAYVNFQHAADAENALDHLNFVVILGKPIRIMWSQRDPTLRKSGIGNVFIKNLDNIIGTKDIYDTFSTFGRILSCKVPQTPEGKSKGFGFVHYETEEAAKKAIDKVNGMLLSNKKLFVGQFVPRRERIRIAAQQPKTFTNVYIKHIPESYDDNKLKEMFGPYGEIVSAQIMLDKDGKSRGFGFVSFKSHESAENVVKELNGKEVQDGCKLFVGRAMKKAERVSRFMAVNIYVKNLDDSTTDSELKMKFEHFGVITSAKVMTTEEGSSRGFGFVCFTTPEEAERAIIAMNQKVCNGKVLYVALAQRKEERRELLVKQFLERSSEMNMYANNGSTRMGSQMAQTYGSNRYFMPSAQSVQQPLLQSPGYFPGTPAPMSGFEHRWVQSQSRQDCSSYGQGQYRQPYRTYSGPIGSASRSANNPRPFQRQFTGVRPAIAFPRQTTGPQREHTFNGQTSGPGPSTSGSNSPTSSSQNKQSLPKVFEPGLGNSSAISELLRSGLPSLQLQQTDEKQQLGERLFPLVHFKYPAFAGKVTGMLLEMRNSEILALIDDPGLLTKRIDEAIVTLGLQNQYPLSK